MTQSGTAVVHRDTWQAMRIAALVELAMRAVTWHARRWINPFDQQWGLSHGKMWGPRSINEVRENFWRYLWIPTDCLCPMACVVLALRPGATVPQSRIENSEIAGWLLELPLHHDRALSDVDRFIGRWDDYARYDVVERAMHVGERAADITYRAVAPRRESFVVVDV